MAFGRSDKNGDPFGGSSNPFGSAPPVEASAPTASPAADPGASVRSALRFDAFLALLFAVLSLGGTAFMLVRNERDALDDPVQKAERGEVIGTDGFSLVNATNLQHAFAVTRAALKPDEQLTNLRLAPARLDVQVRNTIGRQRLIQVGLDYKARVVSDAGTSSDTGPRGLAGIDTGAPERFVNTVLQREGYPPKSLDYLVYLAGDEDTPARWDAYFTEVPVERNHFTAGAHGEVVEQ